MLVTVGIIGKAHGLRGEVTVDVRTDEPGERFAIGSVLATTDHGDLTVESARSHGERLLVAFEEVPDRTAAEGLRGTHLLAEAELDDDSWYEFELVGLIVQLEDGTKVGEVTALQPGAAHDLLVFKETAGVTTSIPFVHQLVPEVDIDAGYVVIDPPGGLLSTDADAIVVSEETGQRKPGAE